MAMVTCSLGWVSLAGYSAAGLAGGAFLSARRGRARVQASGGPALRRERGGETGVVQSVGWSTDSCWVDYHPSI